MNPCLSVARKALLPPFVVELLLLLVLFCNCSAVQVYICQTPPYEPDTAGNVSLAVTNAMDPGQAIVNDDGNCHCHGNLTPLSTGAHVSVTDGSSMTFVSVRDSQLQNNSSSQQNHTADVVLTSVPCAWRTPNGTILTGAMRLPDDMGKKGNCTLGSTETRQLTIHRATGLYHSGNWSLMAPVLSQETAVTKNVTNLRSHALFGVHVSVIAVPANASERKDGSFHLTLAKNHSAILGCRRDDDCELDTEWCRPASSKDANQTAEGKVCQPICLDTSCGTNSVCSSYIARKKERNCQCKEGFYHIPRQSQTARTNFDCVQPTVESLKPIISWRSEFNKEVSACQDADALLDKADSSPHQTGLTSSKNCSKTIHAVEGQILHFRCKVHADYAAVFNLTCDFLAEDGEVMETHRAVGPVLQKEPSMNSSIGASSGTSPDEKLADQPDYFAEFSYRVPENVSHERVRCAFNLPQANATVADIGSSTPIKTYGCSNKASCTGRITKVASAPEIYVMQGSALNLTCESDFPLLANDTVSDCSWSLVRDEQNVATFKFYSDDASKVSMNATLHLGSGAWMVKRILGENPTQCNVQIEKAGLEAQGNWSCSLRLYNGQEALSPLMGKRRRVGIVVVAPASVTVELTESHEPSKVIPHASQSADQQAKSTGAIKEKLEKSTVIEYDLKHNYTEELESYTFFCHARNATPAPIFRWFVRNGSSGNWNLKNEEAVKKPPNTSGLGVTDYTSNFTKEFNTEGRRLFRFEVKCEIHQYISTRTSGTNQRYQVFSTEVIARVILRHGSSSSDSLFLQFTVIMCLMCLGILAIWAIYTSETMKRTRRRCRACFARVRSQNRPSISTARRSLPYTYSPRPVSRRQSLRDKALPQDLDRNVSLNMDTTIASPSPDPTLGRSMSLIPTSLNDQPDGKGCLCGALKPEETERRCSCDVRL